MDFNFTLADTKGEEMSFCGMVFSRNNPDVNHNLTATRAVTDYKFVSAKGEWELHIKGKGTYCNTSSGLHLCDPELNTECKKTSCLFTGSGDCYQTKNPAYQKICTKDGEKE
jgi:hypothetical protein